MIVLRKFYRLVECAPDEKGAIQINAFSLHSHQRKTVDLESGYVKREPFGKTFVLTSLRDVPSGISGILNNVDQTA